MSPLNAVHVLILGLGQSGLAMARWCTHAGARVTVADTRSGPPGAAALAAECPQARFVWVGDGPARGALQRDNPDFIFCGVQRGEALARHFASGDLFLFPSRSETFGNVTLEALASGVPTIAFDYGAAREALRDGVHGAAIACTEDSNGDDAGFIAAAMRLAADDALRMRMRDACRHAVAALRPARVAEDLDRLLRSLADAGAPHAAALAR